MALHLLAEMPKARVAYLRFASKVDIRTMEANIPSGSKYPTNRYLGSIREVYDFSVLGPLR